MDKFEIIEDMCRHPEKYSDDEMKLILKDKDNRELYNLLCDTTGAFKARQTAAGTDVDKEWLKFKQRNKRRKRFAGFVHNRAAAVAAIVTVAAAAIAVGLTVTVKDDADKTVETTASGQTMPSTALEDKKADDIGNNMPQPVQEEIIYENETLEKILTDMARHYGLELKIDGVEQMQLRLYFKWRTADSAEEAIRQLNNFEKINLRIEDDRITDK